MWTFFLPYSGQIADRVNLRYFITIGMLGKVMCACNMSFPLCTFPEYCILQLFTVTEGLILQAVESQQL